MAFGDDLVECSIHYCDFVVKRYGLWKWQLRLTATVNVEREGGIRGQFKLEQPHVGKIRFVSRVKRSCHHCPWAFKCHKIHFVVCIIVHILQILSFFPRLISILRPFCTATFWQRLNPSHPIPFLHECTPFISKSSESTSQSNRRIFLPFSRVNKR